MCTLSWQLRPSGYALWFNRDEQRSRPRALPPRWDSALDAIFPVDPAAGGTWLAVHRSGGTLCLLNGSGASPPASARRSRGELIPALLSHLDDVDTALGAMALDRFAPFTLCHFPADLRLGGGEVSVHRWEGGTRTRTRGMSPLTSSSVALDLARVARHDAYLRLVTHRGGGAEHALRFHRCHLPAKSALSVCMHRPDAQTVSFSQVSVEGGPKFRYQDGPPCEGGAVHELAFPTLADPQGPTVPAG